MKEIRFYHVQNTTVYETLPAILQQVYDMGFVGSVIVPQSMGQKLSDCLWQEGGEDSFLPHCMEGQVHSGTNGEKHGAKDSSPVSCVAPFTLVCGDARPPVKTGDADRKNIYFFVDEANGVLFKEVHMVYFMFHAHDGAVLESARSLWKMCSAEAMYVPVYYTLSQQGRWERKR